MTFQTVVANNEILPFQVETAHDGPVHSAAIRRVASRGGLLRILTPENLPLELNHAFVLGIFGVPRKIIPKIIYRSYALAKRDRQNMLDTLGLFNLNFAATKGFQEKLLHLESPAPQCNKELSPNHKAVLERAAAGQTMEESAFFVNMTIPVVMNHRMDLIQKLATNSITESIMASYLSNLISPHDTHRFQSAYLDSKLLPFQIRTQNDGPLHTDAYSQAAWRGGILGIHTEGRLSTIENQLLVLRSLGLRNDEVPMFLGHEGSYARPRPETVYRKLGVRGLGEAIGRAFSEEIFTVDRPVSQWLAVPESHSVPNTAAAVLLSHMAETSPFALG